MQSGSETKEATSSIRQLTKNGLHRLVVMLQSKQQSADGPSDMDDMLVVQVIDHKIFDGAQAKKGIKSR